MKNQIEFVHTCSDSDDIILMSSRYVGELLEHSPTSGKHLITCGNLKVTWTAWEQFKRFQVSPQEPYKIDRYYLGSTCTSKNLLLKLGLLTFNYFSSLFWLDFVSKGAQSFKRKYKWVQEV